MPERPVVGKYAFSVFESDTEGFPADGQVSVAGVGELPLLDHLLAKGDHQDRIRQGDLCIVIRDDHDAPVGVRWINKHSHQDRFLGQLSDPEDGPAYLNQMFVLPESRGHGFGRRLMVGSLAIAHESGIERVRLCVDRKNHTMLGLCGSLGFEEVGRQYGLRLGPLTLRVNRPGPRDS